MQCGVPYGSILGPLSLLYILYVNDILKSCKGNILSFADNTTIYLPQSFDHMFIFNRDIPGSRLT